MLVRHVFLALAGVGCLAPPVVQAQAPVSPSGRTLVASCSSCHGPAGHSPGAIPSLAGQSEAQILNALLDFKNDRRDATVMNRHAKGFSDDEIAAIAREISANWR